MKRNVTRGFFVILLFAVSLSLQAQIIRYVKEGGTGDGSSWSNASGNLQGMINASASGNEVWVATGTYKPTAGTDRNISFMMAQGVGIYGGFRGVTTETQRIQRDWNNNVTILSGDIGTLNDNSDNSYHVISNNNNQLNNTARLDGFTITSGNANIEPVNTDQRGGGVYNFNASPLFVNCIFTSNISTEGGGMMNQNASPLLINCAFFANSCPGGRGAGMLNSASFPTLINCSFTGNTDGAIFNETPPTLVNCILWGNNGEVEDIGSMSNVSYSIIQDGFTGTGNLDTDPLFVDAASGNLRLQPSSPAINAGNSAANTIDKDLGAFARKVGVIDMGAYEYPARPVIITQPIASQSVCQNNTAATLKVIATGDGLQYQWYSNSISTNTGGTAINGANTDSYIPPTSVSGTLYYYVVVSGGNPNPATSDIAVVIVSANRSRLYVNAAATGNNTGASWQDAFTDLQSALNYNCLTNPSEIWVAKGTYKPTSGTNRSISFSMKNGVAIYGGFAGTENALSGRNWKTNVTILSGDIGTDGDNSDNSFHVLYNNDNGVDNSAMLDGFTVTGGYGGINDGGGMYNYNASPTIFNCSFINNLTFDRGGGMFNHDGSPLVINCSFSGNSAGYGGGGMANYSSGSPTLINCSFSNNTSSRGGGMYNDLYSYPTVTNSILWGDIGGETYQGFNGYPSLSNCIIQGGCPAFSNCADVRDLDPLFISATDLRLQPCSPAIDAGSDAANTTALDLDGNQRKVGTIDLGAYENQSGAANAVVYVNTAAQPGGDGTSWGTAFNKLQDALALAGKCSNIAQVWVAKGTYYPDEGGGHTDNDLNASFALKNKLAIYGGFAGTETLLAQRAWKTNTTTLSGEIQQDGNNTNNSYHVLYSNNVDNTAMLDGFTVTAGNASAVLQNEGGGMFNENYASPTVANCSFVQNSALSRGGGMANRGASPTIINCNFVQNSAGDGGAMVNITANPNVTNCLFYKNSSNNGGAILNVIASPTFINCTFSQNSASSGAGMINGQDASPSLINCIFWGDGGGEISSDLGNNPTITNSIVQGGCPTNATCNNVLNTDPLFVDAAGGDLHLQACSPAIDAGNDAANTTVIDLDANARRVRTIDMGAYEFQGTKQSLTTYYQDSDGDGYGNAAISVQACIKPQNYVTDNTDFNDNDKNVHLAPLTCPPNVTVNNDGGKCSAVVNYAAPPSAAYSSLHLSQTNVASLNAVTTKTCSANSITSYLRVYNLPALGATGNFTISSVDYGGSGKASQVNLYKWNPTKPLTYDNLTLLSSATPSGAGGSLLYLNQPINGVVPVGYALVIEVKGVSINFQIGNASSQTASSYYSLDPACEPSKKIEKDLKNYIIDVNGSGNFKPVQTGGKPSGSAFSVGNTTNTFVTSDGRTCSFNVTVTDRECPVINCVATQKFCYTSAGIYTIPVLQATDNCAIQSITYNIKNTAGKVLRSGTGNNASGAFNAGTSTITWTVTDVHGNKSQRSAVITINSQILVSIPDVKVLSKGVDANTVYPGYSSAASITLTPTASGGSGTLIYKWSTGATTKSITVSPTALTTYTVTVTDASKCTASCSKQVKVVNVSCSGTKVNVCHNSGTLCIDKGSVMDHLNHGDKLGKCSGSASVKMSRETESMENTEQEQSTVSAGVYPNPTTGAFTLQLNNQNAGPAQLCIVDSKGAVVERKAIVLHPGSQAIELNLHGKTNGLYFVQVLNADNMQTFKVYLQQ